MCRTCSGLLKARRVSRPPKPLPFVANSTLCQAEKLSSCVQLIQLVVNGHFWPLAFSLAASRATSAQVTGGFSGSRPAGLEGVLVVIEDRRRAVEGQAQHLAVRGRVVADDSRDVGGGIELEARILHHLADRHDRALAGHHRRRAHLEHLQDVWGVAGAKGGDAGGERLGIAALERRDDLVFLLALVEALGEIVDPLAERAAHRVPPLDFGLRLGRQGDGGERGERTRDEELRLHENSGVRDGAGRGLPPRFSCTVVTAAFIARRWRREQAGLPAATPGRRRPRRPWMLRCGTMPRRSALRAPGASRIP